MKRLLLASYFFVALSCQRQVVLTKAEMLEYLTDPENGYSVTVLKGDLELSMMYKPKDLIIEQLLKHKTQNEVDSINVALASYEYFVLQFSNKGKEIESYYSGNPQQYSNMVEYLSSGIAKDIRITNKTPIGVHEVAYVPYFGSSGKTSLLLVFKDARMDDDLRIELNDTFFGSGKTEFAFDSGKLVNAPKLDILNF